MLQSIPVSHIAGIGRAKQQLLSDLGVSTVHDLLHYFPYRYDDQHVIPFEQFTNGAKVTAQAIVEDNCTIRWQGKKSVCSAKLRIDERFRVRGIWFNQPYLKQKLVDGRFVIVTGKYDKEHNTIVVSSTDFAHTAQAATHSEWTPVYRSCQGLTQSQLRTFISRAVESYCGQVDEVLPHELVQKYRLWSHAAAVRSMHAPQSAQALHQALRRLVFEEFFLFQLHLQWFRMHRNKGERRRGKAIPSEAFAVYRNSLPFPLTGAQERACQTIADDLQAGHVMNRLLQGDVGSGKTWVAFWGAYAAWKSGYQVALMAPTEILAEQHYAEASRRLAPLGLKIALLTGRTLGKAREQVLAELATGETSLLVGTHALLTETVDFHRLGLVITDEQHRFGVSQRSILRNKGEAPDVLFLSATPIPRTLALVLYGDLDVSVLDERPVGRKPIVTKWIRRSAESEAIRQIRKELACGRQAYIVAPLVEASDALVDVTSAVDIASRMQEQFAGYSVDLLHGKLAGSEKEKVMRSFVQGETQVLVCTTVIEVGIDVPNASVMLIYDAERFGLAQLHQLRGRIGRGSSDSTCFLLSDATSGVAQERLQTMVETNNGFTIAERDLELRGPGEFLGVRQSGLPEFSVGDLTRDYKIMQVAREEAAAALKNPDFWLLPAYAPLRAALEAEPSNTHLKD